MSGATALEEPLVWDQTALSFPGSVAVGLLILRTDNESPNNAGRQPILHPGNDNKT